MITYKIDILAALKAAGYTTTRLRKEKIISEGTLTKLRMGDTSITLASLDKICSLLNEPPESLIQWTR